MQLFCRGTVKQYVRMHFRIVFTLLLLPLFSPAPAQRTGFLDQIRIGFGGGINAAMVVPLEPYNVFEDLEGNIYMNAYSPLFQNIGNQYFVQLEWYSKFLVIGLKPGTYLLRLSGEDGSTATGEIIIVR